jgi:hypothetical protein
MSALGSKRVGSIIALSCVATLAIPSTTRAVPLPRGAILEHSAMVREEAATLRSVSVVPGILRLRNGSSETVTVEARMGSEECDRNPLVNENTMPAGVAWNITAREPICWRQVRAVGIAGTVRGDWTRTEVPEGTTVTLDVAATGSEG